ncbi:SDR family oxidoreductase [Amycolatopsis sp. PS_44_ISF1]|nr:SDR family oxidoreductase [Amycolatopsis sp. PS_44_ISF1]MDT8912169.1 SDR family oxidoreductase [Amycolatopsis sp. PS_44_ISF1]
MGDLDLAEEAAAAYGGRACTLDVRERDSPAAFADAVTEAFGRIDVLVDNAGVMPRRSATRASSRPAAGTCCPPAPRSR